MIHLKCSFRKLRGRLSSTRGQSLVEYSILLAAFAAILVAILSAAKDSYTSELNTLSGVLYYGLPLLF